MGTRVTDIPSFRRLFIDFYTGAHGPTLRLETDAIEDLQALKRLFEVMASQSVVDLFPSEGAVSESVNLLTLQNQPGGFRMQATTGAGDEHSFIWSENAEGWLDAAGLIDGMLTSRGPGHQYLTPEDPVLVVVAFQEALDASE